MIFSVSSSITKNPGLRPYDVLVYSLLDSLKLSNGNVPIPSYVLKELGWHKSQFIKSLTCLKKIGMIKEYKAKGNNILVVLSQNEDDIKETIANEIDNTVIRKIKKKTKVTKVVDNGPRKYDKEVTEVIDYFNQVTGKHLRASANGNYNAISKLLNQHYTIDDMKSVIDKKYKEWVGTKFEPYITPSTLFSNEHFDQYLNQHAPLDRIDFLKKQDEDRQNSDIYGW